MPNNMYLKSQYVVKVNGSELKPAAHSIISIDVNLTSSSNANDCQIVFAGNFDFEYGEMTDGLLNKITPGKKIKVSLGYKRPSQVFIGYINSLDVSYGPDGVMVTAGCLDARGLLMKRYDWKTHANQTFAQIVEEMLRPLKPYVGSISVSVKEPAGDPVKETPKVKDKSDDFQYLAGLAKLTKSSFCMIGDKLMFVPEITNSGKVTGSYAWGENLLRYEQRIDLSDQIEKVVVYGKDPNTQETFSAESKPLSGGKTGAKLSDTVKNKIYEVHSNDVETKEEAQILADSLLIMMSKTLVGGRAQVIGDERIKPGDKAEFEGLDPVLDGTFDVTSVHHRFDMNGFITEIGFNSCTF